MAQDHPKSVKHALKVAEKHGKRDAIKHGVKYDGDEVEGVKINKKDYSHGEINDQRSNKEPNT